MEEKINWSKRIEKLKKIDFNNPKIRREFEKIEESNKKLIESTKVDTSRLHITFDI